MDAEEPHGSQQRAGRGRGGTGTARLRLAGLAVLASIVLAACSAANGATPADDHAGGSATAAPGSLGGGGSSPTPDAPVITLAPGTGAAGIAPDAAVTAHVTNGTLSTVTLTDSSGASVPGTLAPGGTDWTATGPLAVDTTFTLAATATSASGHQATQRSTFTTLTPSKTFTAQYNVDPGATYGVGMPVEVTFNKPIADKAAVQKALTVTTSPPVSGAWSWMTDFYGGDRVDFRPQAYWPANTQVTFHMNLDGVDAGNGYYGTQNRTVNFSIGRAVIATADVNAHTLTVTQNGQVLKVLPDSAGGPAHATWEGIMPVVDKEDHITMNSETVGLGTAYNINDVRYAVRLTPSGTFIHAAPWNDGYMGNTNNSHGCVGLSMDNAQWVWNTLIPGDPVVVVNSTSPVVQESNGYGGWNVPWQQWLANSHPS